MRVTLEFKDSFEALAACNALDNEYRRQCNRYKELVHNAARSGKPEPDAAALANKAAVACLRAREAVKRGLNL